MQRRVFGSMLCGFVLASATASADVFRCTVDGKTIYSDKPCGAGATKLRTDEGLQQPFAPTLQHEANMGRVAVGQTPAQVLQAWGEPVARRIEGDDSGNSEEWAYDRSMGRTYVRFRHGFVSSVALAEDDRRRSANSRGDPLAGERAEKAEGRKFIAAGMSRAEVRARIGEPDSLTASDASEVWAYQPVGTDPYMTTIFFRGDRVYQVSRIARPIDAGGTRSAAPRSVR